MEERKSNQLLRALSVPVIVLAFFPLWIVVSSVNYPAIQGGVVHHSNHTRVPDWKWCYFL
jgi:hypothetical protein